MPWRALAPLAAAIAFVAMIVIVGPRRSPHTSATPLVRHPESETVIIDEAGMPPLDRDGRTQQYLHLIRRESGVDLRVLFVPGVPGGDLEGYSLRRAREMKLGTETGRRGLLFVYEMTDKRLRIEVTPGLEGMLPDAFVGYLMRENTQYFFNEGNPGLGLRTTLRILQLRLRRAALGEGYDPAVFPYAGDPATLAAGAGATSQIAHEDPRRAFIRAPATHDDSLRLAPSASVEGSFTSWLLWLGSDRFITGLPLFTYESQRYLETFPITRGYFDFWKMGEFGRRHAVVERGDLAVVYYTNDPIINPHFFRRVNGHWCFDMMVELAQTAEYAGGAWVWSYRRGDDRWTRTFADIWVDIDGVTRVKGGDNRRMPVSEPDR